MVVGFVTAKETGAPLPYADVLVEGTRASAFVDSLGRFRVSGLPAGDVRIRIRRVGFSPKLATVTVRAGVTDTVRVALDMIAIQLERVSVRETICPGGGSSRDTTVVAILQQMLMNAERAAMLAQQIPFESSIERVVGDEMAFRGLASRIASHNVVIDTLWLPSEHEWKYEPGKLVEVPSEQGRVARAQMKIPQLVDFASEPFVASHCFRYAGVETLDGRRFARIAFEPTKDVKDPDITGSLYLDPGNYQIVRSTLYLEMPAPTNPLQTWETRVDTWFREILPALSVIDRVCKRMVVRGTRGYSALASAEAQRLLELRFLDGPPPGFVALQPAQTDSTRRTACPAR